MTQLRYVTLHDEQPARGFWDQALVEWLAVQRGWSQGEGIDDNEAVIVVPGRMNYGQEPDLAILLGILDRCVLLVTGDEEARFDAHAAAPNALARWIQTPTVLADGDRFLPLGAPPHPWPDRRARDFDWCFAGQVTHDRRRAAIDAAQSIPHGLLLATDRFGVGLPPADYLTLLSRSRLVPCPSGPVHPETFRLYEALESGCIPIVDAKTVGGEWAWWWRDHFTDRPFPLVSEWAELPDIAPGLLVDWQHTANRCTAWWKNRKLDLATMLAADAGDAPELVTTIVTMSPIPSHPSIDVLAETISSLLEWGPAGEIIVACDGVHPDNTSQRDAYEDAIAAVCHRALHDPDWQRIRVIVADTWVHQANMLRAALAFVTTPLILFSEHDTPLCGPVPWDELGKVIDVGDANVIRLAHEASVHPEHLHLMIGDGPTDVGGVPLWRTMQFSARPHLASVDWYRKILADWFPETSRTFTEDRIYGPITERPWEWAKVMMYCPVGESIKRSWHTDGRAGALKAPAIFA